MVDAPSTFRQSVESICEEVAFEVSLLGQVHDTKKGPTRFEIISRTKLHQPHTITTIFQWPCGIMDVRSQVYLSTGKDHEVVPHILGGNTDEGRVRHNFAILTK